MLVTLASMLGQIGLPGGGFGLSYHYANGGAPSADSPVMPGITDGGKAVAGAAWLTSAGAATIPCARVVDMLLNPGKPFDFNGKRANYPDVKMAYWVGGNPLRISKTETAWSRLSRNWKPSLFRTSSGPLPHAMLTSYCRQQLRTNAMTSSMLETILLGPFWP